MRNKNSLIRPARRLAFWLLGLSLGAGRAALAQGFLPVAESTAPATTQRGPVLIGQDVPALLKVAPAKGNQRTLLSYKAPLEVLAVGFLSDECEFNQKQWDRIRRFYHAYKDWHVAFVAVNVDPKQNLDTLQKALDRNGLPFAAVNDIDHLVATKLSITYVPEWVIIDEGGQLRYRGPLQGVREGPLGQRPGTPYARQAMDKIVSHIESVPNPEPGEKVGCDLP